MIIDFKRKGFSISSTFLLDHIKVVSILYLCLIVASYFFIDKSLAAFFNSLSPIAHYPFLLIEKLFCPIAWALITPTVFFYIRFILRKEKKSRKLWYVSLAIPLTALICKILEVSFGRATPEWFFLHQESPFRFLEWNHSFHSFPSITAVTIAALATSLSCILAKYRFFLLTGGALLTFVPVISANCFLSDALAGFYVGAVLAQWIFKMMRKEISI